MNQKERRAWNAAKNRRELIAEGFSRRDFARLGLLTGAGYLVSKRRIERASRGSVGESTHPGIH